MTEMLLSGVTSTPTHPFTLSPLLFFLRCALFIVRSIVVTTCTTKSWPAWVRIIGGLGWVSKLASEPCWSAQLCISFSSSFSYHPFLAGRRLAVLLFFIFATSLKIRHIELGSQFLVILTSRRRSTILSFTVVACIVTSDALVRLETQSRPVSRYSRSSLSVCWFDGQLENSASLLADCDQLCAITHCTPEKSPESFAQPRP
ncbi:hypothetical protein HD806DRAFT_145692 [Xylariaceae sp. AK1471]|nr:hypothetical protein HD806DRAFT_145692 [Xylariaceae sp. AK1471]